MLYTSLKNISICDKFIIFLKNILFDILLIEIGQKINMLQHFGRKKNHFVHISQGRQLQEGRAFSSFNFFYII